MVGAFKAVICAAVVITMAAVYMLMFSAVGMMQSAGVVLSGIVDGRVNLNQTAEV